MKHSYNNKQSYIVLVVQSNMWLLKSRTVAYTVKDTSGYSCFKSINLQQKYSLNEEVDIDNRD